MFRKSTKIISNHHRATDAAAYSSLILIVCAALLCFTSPATAVIVTTGDVDPDDPATWDENMIAHIGNTSKGSLKIMGGGEVSSGYVYIGY